jgi:hypothetical protein
VPEAHLAAAPPTDPAGTSDYTDNPPCPRRDAYDRLCRDLRGDVPEIRVVMPQVEALLSSLDPVQRSVLTDDQYAETLSEARGYLGTLLALVRHRGPPPLGPGGYFGG